MTTFIEAVRNKSASLAQVDEWTERWHKGEAGAGLELREFLGMTKQQYAAWMRDPAVLGSFVN